jgi:hypothetical protein
MPASTAGTAGALFVVAVSARDVGGVVVSVAESDPPLEQAAAISESTAMAATVPRQP